MKKRKNKSQIILLIIILIGLSAYSQEVFIYNESGTKVYFQKKDNIIQIKFKSEATYNEKLEAAKLINTQIEIPTTSTKNRISIPVNKDEFRNYDKLKKNKSIVYANQPLLSDDGEIQIPTDKILVKIKSKQYIGEILNNLGIEFENFKRIGYDKDSYIIFLNNGESVNIANTLYESGYFEYAQPSFTRFMKVNNEYYADQWGLNNTGQNNATEGIDIKATEAWELTTGCNDIIVAVIDQGVDLDHPDLAGNLLIGFDATDGGDGGINGDCWGNDAHGTNCAGIIAAVDNTIGTIGVAPDCSILPIRVFYTENNIIQGDDDWVIDAINHAWEIAGADILSCSWGGGQMTVPAVDNEITAALSQGRNNLGCIIVFATGNENDSINWPANSNPDIISVGAMSPCGERKNPSSCDGEDWYRPYPYNDYLGGSNYGSQLDLIAPGVFIPSTDIQGSAGYNNSAGTEGDYYLTFNGTSAAAPHVAGVAALILSVNPYLTQDEVRDIIESTASKVGSYNYSTVTGRNNGTWDNEVGYGCVNAFAAVNAIYPFITGSSPVCVSGSTFIIHNLPFNATINWNHSNFLTYISGQGKVNYTVKASRFTTSSEGWVEAEISVGGCDPIVIRKEIWVGKAGQPTTLPSGYPTIDVPLEAYLYIALTNTPGASASMPTTWWSTGSLEVDNPTPSGCTFHAYETGTGNFYVTTQNACGTSATAGGTVDVYSGGGGGDDPPIPLALSIQPNPANDYIDAEIIDTDSETANSELQIILFNNRSIPVYTGNAHQKTFRINTGHLPHGLYILQVVYKGNKYSKQVLIEQ